MNDIFSNVASGVLTAAIVGGGAFLLRPIREFLRYKSHEYYLWHDSNDTRCVWDIQWEGERLTIDAEGVHNDFLETVELSRNGVSHHQIAKWEVRDEFVAPDRWPVQIKLDAIVRKKTGSNRVYNVHFVVRRRR